jgi:hypothetical protein
LKVSEFKVGDYITIEEPRVYSNGTRDFSWVGDVLEVVAVQEPFIAVKDNKYFGKPFSLDTREYKLMALTREYARALLGIEADVLEAEVIG